MKKKITGIFLSLAVCAASFFAFFRPMTLTVNGEGEPSRVDSLISEMSLRQKVEQLIMVSFQKWDDDTSDGAPALPVTAMNPQIEKILSEHGYGAVILMGENLTETEKASALTSAMQDAAMKNGGIPLIICADQEGGSVFRLGFGTALPGNMALGATGDPKSAYTAGTVIGRELSAIGVNTCLSPVADVNCNANNPVIGLRSYSDDAETVGKFASACVDGLSEAGVVSCAKHFPGHGDTEVDSHYGLPMVDKPLSELEKNELLPYGCLIDADVDMIMTAHILYPQLEGDKAYSSKTGRYESLPSTMSDDIITGLLKEKLGFSGVVCTDGLGMAGIADNWSMEDACRIAVSAGADLLCVPVPLCSNADSAKLERLTDSLVKAVESGAVKPERLDDACRRILSLKEKRGILDYDGQSCSAETAADAVGSAYNRKIERELAARAVTVIKNDGGALPLKLSAGQKLLMLTPYENETGLLAMGWNRALEAGLIPESAAVEIIRYTENNTEACLASIDSADAVLIVSEISSLEQVKNRSVVYSSPVKFAERAKSLKKTAVIMSADKPYDVQLYGNVDAIMAVYGCIGSDISADDVLRERITESASACGPNITAGVEVAFGVYGASGRLPVNIYGLDPETYSYTDEVVYARWSGLTYAALARHDPTDTGSEKAPDMTSEATPATTSEAASAAEAVAEPGADSSRAGEDREAETAMDIRLTVIAAAVAVLIVALILVNLPHPRRVRKNEKR